MEQRSSDFNQVDHGCRYQDQIDQQDACRLPVALIVEPGDTEAQREDEGAQDHVRRKENHDEKQDLPRHHAEAMGDIDADHPKADLPRGNRADPPGKIAPFVSRTRRPNGNDAKPYSSKDNEQVEQSQAAGRK